MKTVLVQGAGGGGGNNLIRSLRQSSLDLRILGSNCLPHAVAKSTADQTFRLPASGEPEYAAALRALIERENIDLVIPNSDREVAAVSALREELPCAVFLPEATVIDICQDKHKLYLRLCEAGTEPAPAVSLEESSSVEAAFAALPASEKYWVRPRRGSGSRGATWVRTPEQARQWIQLWVDLRSYSVADFQIANFLTGRDYCFQSVWNRGQLVVAKLCERLSYYGGGNRLSGMSSTPEIARTLRDDAALETIFRAVRSLCTIPHGNFNMDLKGDASGHMRITEVNIGRFCMITTIFDSTGKINTAEAYVRCALSEALPYGDPIDIEEGYLLIRELDTEPLVIHESAVEGFTRPPR